MANFASRISVESIVTIFTRQSAVEFGFFDLCQRKHVFLYDYLFAYRFFRRKCDRKTSRQRRLLSKGKVRKFRHRRWILLDSKSLRVRVR